MISLGSLLVRLRSRANITVMSTLEIYISVMRKTAHNAERDKYKDDFTECLRKNKNKQICCMMHHANITTHLSPLKHR